VAAVAGPPQRLRSADTALRQTSRRTCGSTTSSSSGAMPSRLAGERQATCTVGLSGRPSMVASLSTCSSNACRGGAPSSPNQLTLTSPPLANHAAYDSACDDEVRLLRHRATVCRWHHVLVVGARPHDPLVVTRQEPQGMRRLRRHQRLDVLAQDVGRLTLDVDRHQLVVQLRKPALQALAACAEPAAQPVVADCRRGAGRSAARPAAARSSCRPAR
jgi:hypothetical protein